MLDNTLENVETLDDTQAKFDDILDSPSIDVAFEKIKSLVKAKDLDSSLILLINGAWAKAKESTTMKEELVVVAKPLLFRALAILRLGSDPLICVISEISPSVWYIGLFNGIGPTRTPSKMYIHSHAHLPVTIMLWRLR
ncbi:hypothetical protein HN51_051676 [Arachis hypogaea]